LVLILSDINMPGMSGLEMLPKAKAAQPDVPVIMITAYGDDNTKKKVLEGGAEGLLTKPIDFVALRSEIDSRVASHALPLCAVWRGSRARAHGRIGQRHGMTCARNASPRPVSRQYFRNRFM
jgi:DNA-binding response OmpR family regulator